MFWFIKKIFTGLLNVHALVSFSISIVANSH